MSFSIKTGIKYMLQNLNRPRTIMINPGNAAWIHPGIYTLIATKTLEYIDKYAQNNHSWI